MGVYIGTRTRPCTTMCIAAGRIDVGDEVNTGCRRQGRGWGYFHIHGPWFLVKSISVRIVRLQKGDA